VRKERTFRSGPYLDDLFRASEEQGRVDAYLQREICHRIRKARKEAGLTQEDAANLLSVTTRAYQNYERDRVPFRSLDKIARLFNVTQEWLLRGDPQEAVSPPVELLRAAADGIAELSRSQESVHERLDEVLERLGRLEAGLSSAADARQ
jgi:transcriptional regulator with XRE-family HTH domain